MNPYTIPQLTAFPWIVSTDTLRADHLADAFLGAFDCLGQDVPEPFCSDLRQAASYASDRVGQTPCDAWEIALSWAENRLGELAPLGFYFGTSEGDGACFGFWLENEWCAALQERGIDCEDPASTAALLARFDDHGVTAQNLEDAYCGTADGYSEKEAGADYAQTLADDIGAINPELAWPHTCIDWEDAWRELELGDGYALIPTGNHGRWHVVRAV